MKETGSKSSMPLPITHVSALTTGAVCVQTRTPAQSKAIAIDYGIRGATTSIKVRRALLFYALKRLGLDVPPGTRPPHEQHIVLVNREEVEAARGRPVET
jgi:hypothetical protein